MACVPSGGEVLAFIFKPRGASHHVAFSVYLHVHTIARLGLTNPSPQAADLMKESPFNVNRSEVLQEKWGAFSATTTLGSHKGDDPAVI